MLTQALIIALAASADAAYLRVSSEGRRLAGHGGHDDGDCHDDPEWCVYSVLNRALDASTASRTRAAHPPTTQAPQEPRAGLRLCVGRGEAGHALRGHGLPLRVRFSGAGAGTGQASAGEGGGAAMAGGRWRLTRRGADPRGESSASRLERFGI